MMIFLVAAALGREAGAQSAACAGLTAELAALDRRAPAYDPYGDALIKQRASLDRAQKDYSRYCSAGLFSRPNANCPIMAERMQAMQANLQKLERTAPVRPDDSARQRLQNQLRQNRCNEPAPGIIQTMTQPQGGIFVGPNGRMPDGGDRLTNDRTPAGRIFTLPGPNGPMAYREEAGGRVVALGPANRLDTGVRERRAPLLRVDPDQDDDRDRPSDATDEPRNADMSGTFRTLCVRTCDGYYFPISYAASRNQFGNDAEVCKARCPGTETRLFAVKTPGEDGEQSFAADSGSEPYTRLPNALRYRREVVPACTCGRTDPSLLPLAATSQDDRNRDSSLKIGDVRSNLPIPDGKPPIDEDPETLANLEADFIPRPIQPPAIEVVGKPTGPKSIRVVGPKFFADR